MYALRRSASRLFTSRPSALTLPSRGYSSFVPSSTWRSTQPSLTSLATRRWASTAQEVDEHATERAAQSVSAAADPAPAIAESANLTEATEEALPAAETNENIIADESSPAPTENTLETPKAHEDRPAGRQPRVTKSLPGSMHEKKRSLYIGNLFFDITESELVKEFTPFGQILRCKVVRDVRGLSKGFAYIEFSDLDSAEAAIRSMNMQLYEGRRMTVQYAARNSDDFDPNAIRAPKQPINPPSKTLFVGNLSFEMTDRDLGNLFRGIRNVLDVRVAIDRRTGQPRGFAHADFVDVKSAMEALKILEQKETYGRKLRVDYSYSSSQSPRYRAGEPRSHPTESQSPGHDEKS